MTITYNKVLIDVTSEFTIGDTIIITDSAGNSITWTSPATYPAPVYPEFSQSLLSFSGDLISGDNITTNGGKLQLIAYGGVINFTTQNFFLGNNKLTFSVIQAGASNTTGAITATTGTVNRSFNNILTRSPYYLSRQDAIASSLQLTLDINNDRLWLTNPTSENLFESTVTLVNELALSDISPLVRDFVPSNFNGTYKTTNASTLIDFQFAGPPDLAIGFDGYGYFEDGYNPVLEKPLMQSNTYISKPDDSPVRIPVLRAATDSVQFVYNGDVIYSADIGTSIFCDEQILYVSNVVNGADDFMQRVLMDGGIFEDSSCFQSFEGLYTIYPVQKIYITGYDGSVEIIDVESIDECKYEPYKLTFINKFGALQDLWFYKRSDLSMDVETDSYRSSVLSSVKDSGGVYNTTYDTSNHQYRNIYVSGKESLRLSSGFYRESYNEIFRQLMLSEVLWIEYDNVTLPANIKASSIKYKTQLNDKLINYEIDLEFAFDKINSIN